jgi:eukaryotic-like serine/threonine-protein kinase
MTSAGNPEQFGGYRIIDQLGKGGMSTVHLAEVREADGASKMVALKRLLPAVAARAELRESFVHEANLMRYLHQRNIPETYETGKINGVYFIAMEFVPGPTLKELVDHCGSTVGTVPIEITLNIVAQICEALDHAHKQRDERGKPLGIVHRDISPANLILSESGLVKLIDFGLAKASIQSVQTGEGIIKGKFNYVAPEYLGGELDARVDIWALGVVMYELLTSAHEPALVRRTRRVRDDGARQEVPDSAAVDGEPARASAARRDRAPRSRARAAPAVADGR